MRFPVVGAYALGIHGRPRATGDLDVWVEASPENAPRVMRALAPWTRRHPDAVNGLRFADAWPDRLTRPFGDVQVGVIGRAAFIRNKRATGCTKDLADIEGLDQT